MGIEKLVPTMADLDRFLKILARSATGQKLSVSRRCSAAAARGRDAVPTTCTSCSSTTAGRAILAGETAEISDASAAAPA